MRQQASDDHVFDAGATHRIASASVRQEAEAVVNRPQANEGFIGLEAIPHFLAGNIGVMLRVKPTRGSFMRMGFLTVVGETANAFCATKGKEVEAVSEHETDSGFGKIASADLEFRCMPGSTAKP